MDQPDIVIENAWVVDGSGSPPRKRDVALKGDRIIALADTLPDHFKLNTQRIDATGKTLTPGFIDVHAHGELEPLADNSAAGKVTEGVTSEISGNCGLSPFPLLGALRTRYEKEALDEYGWPKEHLNWTHAGEYFGALEETGCTINRGFLLGHGSLRAAVNGYTDGAVGPEGRTQMLDLLEDSLQAGCFGLSTGLCYPPGCYAPREEIMDLAKVCAQHGALYTSHMRSESDQLEEAIEETLDICRTTKVRTQISHLKTSHPRNWHKISFLEKSLLAARKEGLDFNADRYPYVASSTGLDAVLPRWAYAGGNAEELKRLNDPKTCEKFEAEILALNPKPDYWDRIQIAGVIHAGLRPHIAGRTVSDIAAEWKVRPFEAFRRICIEDELRTSAIFFSMSEENLEKIFSWDFVMVASDASARNVTGPTRVASPHPRAFGTFPRMLARYVREKKLMTLHEAVRRMTSLPAEAFHIKDRGLIREGAFADLVLFDAEKICDQATFSDPNQFSTGIDKVYVNGKLVVENGVISKHRPGVVLRHSNN